MGDFWAQILLISDFRGIPLIPSCKWQHLELFYFCYFYTLLCQKIAPVANAICLWKPTLNKVSCILYRRAQTLRHKAISSGTYGLYLKAGKHSGLQ